MAVNKSNHYSIRIAKRILSVLLFSVIILLAFSLRSLRTPEQSSSVKKIPEEALQEMLPAGPKIMGIVDDRGYDYLKKRGYEYLQVNIKVYVEEEGTYSIQSRLFDNKKKLITIGNLADGAEIDIAALILSTELSAGFNTVSVYFDGASIRNMKVNGPYTVEIFLCSEGSKVLDKAEFLTSKYKYRKFSSW